MNFLRSKMRLAFAIKALALVAALSSSVAGAAETSLLSAPAPSYEDWV